MKKDKSEVIFLIDRSGSMINIKSSTEKGFCNFLEKQKSVYGECLISLYEFDHEFKCVYSAIDINNVSEYTLTPRGWTALFDAIGMTINEVGQRLNNTPENERPENVIIVILTDGQENKSKKFTQRKVKELIAHQQDKYNWKFIFLGSNQDAVLTAQKYGFDTKLSMTYDSSSISVCNTFEILNSGVSCLRSSLTKDSYAFSDEDRKKVLEN